MQQVENKHREGKKQKQEEVFASTALGRKGTVIHRWAIRDEQT
jgi:hypothetical protein